MGSGKSLHRVRGETRTGSGWWDSANRRPRWAAAVAELPASGRTSPDTTGGQRVPHGPPCVGRTEMIACDSTGVALHEPAGKRAGRKFVCSPDR